MRLILYIFTMALLFVSGMLVGNSFLPERNASLASAVSVPGLPVDSPILQTLTREQAEQDLVKLKEALATCPDMNNAEKTQLLNRIMLRLAIENFEFKKTKLELEIAKNNKNNRPTNQLTQATSEYNQALETVKKLSEELFPEPEDEIPLPTLAPIVEQKS